MKKILLLLSLVSLFVGIAKVSASEIANQLDLQEDKLAIETREKLNPLVRSSLSQHCGDECPSFKLDVQIKKISDDVIEDLGFSSVPKTESIPTLGSVALTVLIHKDVSQASQETLKLILSHLVTNHTGVFSQVQFQNFDTFSPAFDKEEEVTPEKKEEEPFELSKFLKTHGLELLDKLIWPASVLLVALLVLFGMILAFRNYRKLLKDKLEAKKRVLPTQSSVVSQEESVDESKQILDSRKLDLQFLIEEYVFLQSLESLKKLLSHFDAQKLTELLLLSPSVLKTISELDMAFSKGDAKPVSKEYWYELKKELDRAHWMRLAEIHFPLIKLKRFSPFQRQSLFFSLPSPLERASCLSALSEDHWADILGRLSSQEKVDLGLAMTRYTHQSMEERRQSSARLGTKLREFMEQVPFFENLKPEHYALYLSEEEAKTLNFEIEKSTRSSDAQFRPGLVAIVSLDSLIEKLDSNATREIFSTLELPLLKATLFQLSEANRELVTQCLPRSLVERLVGSDSRSPEPSELMRARAQLILSCQKFSKLASVGG